MASESKENKNIVIVWDFDKTLTPKDSTSITVDIVTGESGASADFWQSIQDITGKTKKPEWKELLGSDAPAWMYALSRVALQRGIPLNAEFFKEFVLDEIELFPNTIEFLQSIKSLEKTKKFKELGIQIHHFIVSAGLKDLVEQVFPEGLITRVFGCRYTVMADPEHLDEPESIPVFCMDETVKTRALFEISKGSFIDPKKQVNTRVEKDNRFANFDNFIYIGDGPTDIPSLSLTRHNGGLGVVVYNSKMWNDDTRKKLKGMSLDKRADLITPADYSLDGELFSFIKNRCTQICQRYEAENFL
jgi:2-hydroxy-3-keto-5-methylthiopentenyl-1-phosphate phosphatase